MADPLATYRSWSHVGIPGFDPVDLAGADGPVDAEYLKGCFYMRSGRPGRFEGESARFEAWLTGRVALQADLRVLRGLGPQNELPGAPPGGSCWSAQPGPSGGVMSRPGPVVRASSRWSVRAR